ncbi:MAG: pimeloyl-CoA dehydrogenase large subunit [Alphaproteobacteria bacterium]|nr:pimeloyl-CoA dehydrogenase large subunit [Alphaproteobacteria bacterium]
MHLNLTRSQRAFQARVRKFVDENHPPEIRAKVESGLKLGRAETIAWQKKLHAAGLYAPAWPKQWGGPALKPIERYVLDRELALNSTPALVPFGVTMVGPVIYTFGSQAQKDRFLPRILNSDDWWCQGYSEPGSGSDLASLKTRAVREGDHYVVNGQKTWTTLAQYADWIFCLVRTDPAAKQQEGITFLLIDMKTPGVTVRPIVTMDGGAEINDVFLDNVKVPVENRVGEENQGWTYAKFLLVNERFGTAQVGRSQRQMLRLKQIAQSEIVGGRKLEEDENFRLKLAKTEIELLALEYTELRYLAQLDAGKQPGAEANILKIRGTQMQQNLSELLMEAVGYYANPSLPKALEHGWNEEPIGPAYAASLAPAYFNWRKSSIYGGSNEIQRNILSKFVLGL